MADLPPLGVPAASAPPEPSQPDRAARWALLGLSAVAVALLAWRGYGLSRYSTDPPAIQRDAVPLAPLDLNAATEADLASVPGLGETMAARIVLHRKGHGEFRSVDELRQVKGIGEKTLARVRPFFYVGTYTEASPPPPAKASDGPTSRKKPPPSAAIDVNRATVAELQKLPGIGPTLAGRIVEKRQQRPFAGVEELRKVKGIGPKTYEALRPHVTVGSP
jgi:competence ComEA-like helix-hairpin-helix protein